MRFRPSSSYAIIAVLLLGLVGLGTREDKGDGEQEQRAVGTAIGTFPAGARDTEIRDGRRGVDERLAWETHAEELDAVLGMRTVPEEVDRATQPNPVDRPQFSQSRAQPEPPVAAAGLGLSTAPNVEMWRENVQAAGFVDVDAALRVMRCESGGNPLAVGGAGELGLFQIHPRWHPDATTDPIGNIAAAYRISNGGRDWSAWTCKP